MFSNDSLEPTIDHVGINQSETMLAIELPLFLIQGVIWDNAGHVPAEDSRSATLI